MSCLLTEKQDTQYLYTIRPELKNQVSLKASHKPYSRKSHITDKKDHVQCQLPT